MKYYRTVTSYIRKNNHFFTIIQSDLIYLNFKKKLTFSIMIQNSFVHLKLQLMNRMR